MIYLPLLSWSCTYKAYSHLYSSTDVAFNVTIICTAMLSTTASSTIFFSWKTTASIIGQVKSYILDPWNYFCSMGTGISVRCEELLKGNGISDDDDDDVDISTGDCGYQKRPIASKIFRNIRNGSKKIVKKFQTKIQPATWSKYSLKNTKKSKKSKILRLRT